MTIQLGLMSQMTIQDGMMGKGSKRRPTDEKKYSDNWEAIFGKKRKVCKTWKEIEREFK